MVDGLALCPCLSATYLGFASKLQGRIMCTNLRLCCFYCELCIDPDSPGADKAMRLHVETHVKDDKKTNVYNWESADLEWFSGRFT